MENKTVNKKVLWIFLGLLVITFGFLILSNEYTLLSGEEVFLVTQPVDPRDPLRGDYVILSYRIEDEPEIQEFIIENDLKTGDTFYLVLDKDKENIATLDSVFLNNPETQLALKATVGQKLSRDDLYAVELGIGKYFVPEGRGREIERIRDGFHVLVVIDSKGNAKIKDLYHEGERIDLKPKEEDEE